MLSVEFNIDVAKEVWKEEAFESNYTTRKTTSDNKENKYFNKNYIISHYRRL